jgi:hypothetical protein
MTKPKLKPLEPVDHARCQADIKEAHRPFGVGAPPPRWGRCNNKPTWYAREAVAGPDGRKGAMALCDACKIVCVERMGTRTTFEPLVGWNEKFHQLYENPGSVPRNEIIRVLQDAGADAATAAAFEQLVLERWRGLRAAKH